MTKINEVEAEEVAETQVDEYVWEFTEHSEGEKKIKRLIFFSAH